jgi:hypothetical protein
MPLSTIRVVTIERRGGEGEKEFLSSIMGAGPPWNALKKDLNLKFK